jgi:hypothetical protein
MNNIAVTNPEVLHIGTEAKTNLALNRSGISYFVLLDLAFTPEYKVAKSPRKLFG